MLSIREFEYLFGYPKVNASKEQVIMSCSVIVIKVCSILRAKLTRNHVNKLISVENIILLIHIYIQFLEKKSKKRGGGLTE